MLALRELQRATRSALLGGDDELARQLVCDDGIAPAARLGVYRHHVETTLGDVLAGTFPVVRRLVDPRFFAYAADRYLREHPPESPCLFEYGASFPDFLAGFPACRRLAYLADVVADVARLEWALNVASHADDAAPIEASRLAAVPPDGAERLVLRLDPSLVFLRSAWPVDEVWEAHQDGGCLEAVRLDGGEVRLEMRRIGDEVGIRRMPEADFAFRQALGAGSCLERAAAAALAAAATFDLVTALAALLRDGLVVGFETRDDEGERS